jgi:hypothetical protein
MILRNDPATAAMAGLSAVGSIAGGIGKAGALQAQGAAQARAAENQQQSSIFDAELDDFQAGQEQIALERDLDSSKMQQQQTLSSMRAGMAANGGGVDNDLLKTVAGQYGRQQQQLIDDSTARQTVLRMKALRSSQVGDYDEEAGQDALSMANSNANSAILSGAFGAFTSSSAASLLKQSGILGKSTG